MTTAQDIMPTEVTTVGPTSTIAEAAQLMRTQQVGALPVVDDDRGLMGILTDRDIVVHALAVGAHSDSTIEEYGVRDVFTVAPDASLDEIRQLMGDHRVRRLPVVDDGTLVGIIALADVARAAETAAVGATTERISE